MNIRQKVEGIRVQSKADSVIKECLIEIINAIEEIDKKASQAPKNKSKQPKEEG